MITVEGYLPPSQDPYVAQVGVDADRADIGCVWGSPNVVALLRLHTGEQVKLTPTGPTVTLDPDDAETVMGALHGLTRITRTVDDDDEIPSPFGKHHPGTVY